MCVCVTASSIIKQPQFEILGKILVMELTSIEQPANLKQLRLLKRKDLVARHEGKYTPTSYPENFLLPFEKKLRSFEKTADEFINCSEFDFLFQSTPEVRLTKKRFREACEALYRGSDRGEDHFTSAKETIDKHIKTITGKSLAQWQADKEFGQDAFKTAYLLYDLHLSTPSGLEMLTKKADPRFAEVQLFSVQQQPKNRNAKLEDDQVVVLSSWLKEFFSKALFNRSKTERGMAKNLDLIFSEYNKVRRYINNLTDKQLQAKLYTAVFDEQILARKSQPREPLSVKLIRAWQANVKTHNLSNFYSVEKSFLEADKPKGKQRTITAEVKDLLLLGARLFSWILLRIKVSHSTHTLSPSEWKKLYAEANNEEKLILTCFTNDYKYGTKIEVKGIGEDSKRTSLFNSLKTLVDNNRRQLENNEDPSTTINFDNCCETHYTYLKLRADFACYAEGVSAQDFLSHGQHSACQSKITYEDLENYIEAMTLNELDSDIKKVNKILAEHCGVGSTYRLLR